MSTYERPSGDAGDLAHTAIKAAISTAPVIGGPLVELFALVFAAPLAKRRDEWVESIAQGLRDLEERVDGFSVERLAEDESFVTTAVRATQAAIRNHEDEKLEALRNAVLNSALPDAPEDSLQQMYVGLVDEFTTWHLRIAMFFKDPAGWIAVHNDPASSRHSEYTSSPGQVLTRAFPELDGRRDFYDLIVRDLHTRGVLGIDSLHTMMTPSGALGPRTTSFGLGLIRFISEPVT